MTVRRKSVIAFVTFTQNSMKTSTTSSPRFARSSPPSRLARVSAGLVAFVAASAPLVARAEADTFGVGNGRDGALTVNSPGTVINAYTGVSASAAAGATSITVASTQGFAVGQLVLFLRTTGISPIPVSGSQSTVDLSAQDTGRWELARLTSLTATQLRFQRPLTQAVSTMTQVVTVPEYTTVTINASGTVAARPWNGTTGGIVAFLATGAVQNNGSIHADGSGFRGGIRAIGDGDFGCAHLDQPAPGGAAKGEGVAPSRYGATGYGNVANAGGGGICHDSGGGGGSNGGQGGKGGRTWTEDGSRDVGGRGGAVLTFDALTRLLPGGGGGAGYGADDVAGSGGAGGGIVFVRAASLSSPGRITADGSSGGNAENDGAGGAGAGGTIYLRVTGTLACGATSVSARGGAGGSPSFPEHGTGGGGGGGVALLQGNTVQCVPAVGGGVPGTQSSAAAPDGLAYGATSGSTGRTVSLAGPLPSPAQPTGLVPANGSTTNNARPPITGNATANATIIVSLDGVELGRTTAAANGSFSFTPSADIAEGAHVVSVAAEVQAIRSQPTSVTVTFDRTAPNTTITATPATLTNAPNATFTFVSNEAGASFECDLDSGGFAACTSPVAYTGLADGGHTFLVRATDAAGNIDPTPASHAWQIDRTAPDITVGDKPASSTNATNATFSFSSENGATFECRLDAAAFAGCTSPVTFDNIAEGAHTFEVRAMDAAGNVSPPASHAWQIDRTAPDTTIDQKPANPTAATNATFSFSSENGATFECRLDAAAFAACTSPVTFDGLAEGSHTFEVRATDAVGNVDSTPASYTWDIARPPVDAGTDASTGVDASTGDDAGSDVEPGSDNDDDDGDVPVPVPSPEETPTIDDGTSSGCTVRALGASEPSGLALLGFGLAVWFRRRRR